MSKRGVPVPMALYILGHILFYCWWKDRTRAIIPPFFRQAIAIDFYVSHKLGLKLVNLAHSYPRMSLSEQKV